MDEEVRGRDTDAAFAAISAQAHHIGIECRAPESARRWLERIWDAIDSLESFPRRAEKAEEDAYVEYEVRQLHAGDQLILFTVDEEHRKVWIVGLRHGHRLPRPEDLPRDPSSLEGETGEE